MDQAIVDVNFFFDSAHCMFYIKTEEDFVTTLMIVGESMSFAMLIYSPFKLDKKFIYSRYVLDLFFKPVT
jgi:hypothetical protein